MLKSLERFNKLLHLWHQNGVFGAGICTFCAFFCSLPMWECVLWFRAKYCWPCWNVFLWPLECIPLRLGIYSFGFVFVWLEVCEMNIVQGSLPGSLFYEMLVDFDQRVYKDSLPCQCALVALSLANGLHGVITVSPPGNCSFLAGKLEFPRWETLAAMFFCL